MPLHGLVKYEGLSNQASKQKKKIFNKLTKSKVSLSKKKKEKEKKRNWPSYDIMKR